jgi:3-hydroxybutyryl-CoA dehydrogenase
MGPLTLADFMGLDICVDIMRVLQEGMAIRSTGRARYW